MAKGGQPHCLRGSTLQCMQHGSNPLHVKGPRCLPLRGAPLPCELPPTNLNSAQRQDTRALSSETSASRNLLRAMRFLGPYASWPYTHSKPMGPCDCCDGLAHPLHRLNRLHPPCGAAAGTLWYFCRSDCAI